MLLKNWHSCSQCTIVVRNFFFKRYNFNKILRRVVLHRRQLIKPLVPQVLRIKMPTKLEKRNVKLIELILGSCALGFKYQKIFLLTKTGSYDNNDMIQRELFTDLLLCITYFGLLFLKSMACISTISGQIPKGNYVRYFHIFGSIAYASSEIIIAKDQIASKAFTALPVLGTVISVLLIIVLLLDCFNVI